MEDSTGRSSETAEPNERMLRVTSSVWNQEMIASNMHKERDLAERRLALCTTDENTANFMSEAWFFFFPQEAADFSTDSLKGLNKSFLAIFPFSFDTFHLSNKLVKQKPE